MHNYRTDPERGQATIALLAVVALAVVATVVLSIFGEAVVHRARARNAADAIALAAAADETAAGELRAWYRNRNIAVDYDGTRTLARSGPAQAAAWASTQPSTTTPAPALLAIVARAEQLLNETFDAVQWHRTAVTVTSRDASILRTVAGDLGLCEQTSSTSATGRFTFDLC